MAFNPADSCRETTTTTGTGTLSLGGAVTGYRTIVAGVGTGNSATFTLEAANGTDWEHFYGVVTDASPDTLTRTLIASSSGSLLDLADGTHTVYTSNIADRVKAAHHATHATVPGGRLTLTTAVPVTTADVTGATNIYYTPFVSDVINLWDGNFWRPIIFTEYTLALGTLTSGKPYDVFAYLNAGALALEMLVWTNDTTRATAVTIQDGRYCKSGDKTRLLLGSFYTTATTTTEDSVVNRYLSNVYNGKPRNLVIYNGSTHTYTTNTYRAWNNNQANSSVNFVTSLPGVFSEFGAYHSCSSTAANVGFLCGGAFDVTNATHTHPYVMFSQVISVNLSQASRVADAAASLVAGRHFFCSIENSVATGTTSWNDTSVFGTVLA